MNPNQENDREPLESGSGGEAPRDWLWEHLARGHRAAGEPDAVDDDALYAEISDDELLAAEQDLAELERELAEQEAPAESVPAPILGGPSRFRSFVTGQASAVAYAAALLIAITVAGAVRGVVVQESGDEVDQTPTESVQRLERGPFQDPSMTADAAFQLLNSALFTIDVARARLEQSVPIAEATRLEERIELLKLVALGAVPADSSAELSDELSAAIQANILDGRNTEEMIPRLDELFEHAMASLARVVPAAEAARAASANLQGSEAIAASKLEEMYERLVRDIQNR